MRLVRGPDVWEIHHEGTVVRINDTTRRFLTSDHARTAYDKAILEQRAAGFSDAPDVVDDLDARLVLADDLQQRGDPLGELITVQHALSGDIPPAERKKLEKRERSLLEANHQDWWGPLAAFVRKPGNKYPLQPAVEATWKSGFVDTVRIQRAVKHQVEQILAWLRKLPIARNVTTMILGDPTLEGPTTTTIHYAMIFQAMEREGVPSHLRRLVIGDVAPARRARIHLGDARGVIAACSELESLEITAGSGTIAPMHAPKLAELTLHGIHRSALRPLIDSSLPSLVALEITGGEIRELLELLIGAPILQQLKRLTFAHCQMQDAELSILYMHARRFEHLEWIDVRGNHISSGLVKDVRTRLPQLRARGS